MARFTVLIEGEPLAHAMAALDGAGITNAGVTEAYWGEQPPAELNLVRLRAVFQARTAEEAAARIKDNLPPNGRYTVGPIGRLEGKTWSCDLRVRMVPDPIGSLQVALDQIGTVEVSGPDKDGVYDVRVQTSDDRMEDAESAIVSWDVDHPGQILKLE